MSRIGFTGTRNGMSERQRSVVSFYVSRYEHVGEGHHGLCVGADAEFHGLCKRWGLKVIGHPPIRRDLMMPVAHHEFFDLREPRSYLVRNREIVDVTGRLIAAPDREETRFSGTWSTVRYARKLRRPVLIVMPNGDVRFERWSDA